MHKMRVDILSKEYPPQIYGGAGVHVAELVRALRARGDIDAQVRCFGGPRDEVGTTGYADLPELASANAAIATLGVDLFRRVGRRLELTETGNRVLRHAEDIFSAGDALLEARMVLR